MRILKIIAANIAPDILLVVKIQIPAIRLIPANTEKMTKKM
jgi:hypothetical protein